MSAGVDSVKYAGVTVASPEVLGFMAARRTPRARATRKVEAVAHRLIAGGPPLDRARSLWVCGSYARDAPNVRDVDLLLEVDDRGIAHSRPSTRTTAVHIRTRRS